MTDMVDLDKRIDACFKEIKDIRDSNRAFEREILQKVSETERDVSDIKGLLTQIKWLVVGFLMAYGGQLTGFFDLLSKGGNS